MEIKMSKAITTTAIKSCIEKANHIVLTVHVNPDGDALGSMLAMYEYIKSIGKIVYMVVDDQILDKYKSLPYGDRILGIDKYMDMASNANTKSSDLLIILDASTGERIGRIRECIHGTSINIDHHISNTKYADYLYLVPKAAATGEILVDLFREWDHGITASMATALYMAIATDCGFFKFSNTTENTLLCAAFCVKSGADTQHVSHIADFTTKERLVATAAVLETASFHCLDKVAVLSITEDLLRLCDYDTDGFVDFIRNVNGVELAILCKAVNASTTKVSLRSKEIDVNALAARFDGGGHIRAAGCTIHLPMEAAVRRLIDVIEEGQFL